MVTVFKVQADDRMNAERFFRQNVNAERAGLVESHHHAGVSGDTDHPVCYVTGSRAGGCGLDGQLFMVTM